MAAGRKTLPTLRSHASDRSARVATELRVMTFGKFFAKMPFSERERGFSRRCLRLRGAKNDSIAALPAMFPALRASRTALRASRTALGASRETRRASREPRRASREALRASREALRASRTALRASRETLRASREPESASWERSKWCAGGSL